jgi:hypothetical protein
MFKVNPDTTIEQAARGMDRGPSCIPKVECHQCQKKTRVVLCATGVGFAHPTRASPDSKDRGSFLRPAANGAARNGGRDGFDNQMLQRTVADALLGLLEQQRALRLGLRLDLWDSF